MKHATPDEAIVEKGDIYFAYRPKVELPEAEVMGTRRDCDARSRREACGGRKCLLEPSLQWWRLPSALLAFAA